MLRKNYPIASFKALDPTQGTFEAIVSVFGNVDFQGDRMVPGAFAKSIANWQKSGDPVPAVWSHDWADPFAHVGYSNPQDLVEVTATEINPAGLKVIGKMDVHKPFAKQVYDLLLERRVKEWSFGYDVVRERRAADGANELLEVNLIEYGPTLKGANPDTATLGVKTRLERAREQQTDLDTFMSAMSVAPELAKALAPSMFARLEAQAKADEEAEKAAETKPWHVEKRGDKWCVIKDSTDESVSCHETEEDANAAMRALYANENDAEGDGEKDADEGDGEKAVAAGRKFIYAAPAGSDEERQQYLNAAVNAWVDETYSADAEGDRKFGCVVGTYSDHVVVSVESFDADPEYFTIPYTVADDGESVTLGDPAPADIEVQVTAKADADPGFKAGRVIGSKALTALKSTLASAVDDFASEVNSATSEGDGDKAEGVKSRDPNLSPEVEAFLASLEA